MSETVPNTRRQRHADLLQTVLTTAAAILLALVIGAFIIVLSNERVLDALGYFGAYPWDTFRYGGEAVWSSYKALVTGSVGSGEAISETLNRSAPLICAGLGVTLAFRAGLFNIGSQGQLVLGTLAASYVGFTWSLPTGVHLAVSVVCGIVAGALWGGIAGFLKARTGAHEVISTIMLNQIAVLGVLAYALNQDAFQFPGDTLDRPTSPPVADSAAYPTVGGVHLGVLLTVAAALLVWWILERSRLGFELRAVGFNPDASRTAGMSLGKAYTVAMLVAGALSGLAATMLINGDQLSNSASLAGTVGFDAITVALLGRATPLGTVLAGLLFGALTVGSGPMQTQAGTEPELVYVLQALIVLFVAAPALIRWLVRRRRLDQDPTFAPKEVAA